MRPASSGFTLIELMVAIAVSMFFAIIAYVGLGNVQIGYQSANESMERLNELQFAMRRLAQDMAQLHPRPIREELADGYLPALASPSRDGYPLEFTRGGWSNPLGLPRPSVQRVAYLLEDETLVRRHWNVVDRTLANEPLDVPILREVLQIDVRFLDYDREWREEWPPLDGAPAAALRLEPLVVEITLELADFGVITRLFEVAG